MAAAATLKDVTEQLRILHKDNIEQRKLVNAAIKKQGIGASTFTGVLADNFLASPRKTIKSVIDRTKKASKTALNYGSLGIVPAVGGIGKAIRTARSNREQKNQIKEEILSRGDVPSKAAATEKSVETSSANSERIAEAVERIANTISDFIKSISGDGTAKKTISGMSSTKIKPKIPPVAGKADDSETEDDADGDSKKAKSRNKLIRFARVQSKIIGKSITDNGKKTIAATRSGFSSMGRSFMGAARFIVMGIVSAIGTVVAAVAPFLPVILAAGVILAEIAIAAKYIAQLWTLGQKTKEIRKRTADMGADAIKDFAANDVIKDKTVGTVLDMQQGKVNAAKAAGEKKVEISLPGQGTYNVKTEDAEAMIRQARIESQIEGTTMMSVRDLEAAQLMTMFDDRKAGAESRRRPAKPMNLTDAESYTDTEYLDIELKRLESLKASGHENASTVSQGLGLFSPTTLNGLYTNEIPIDEAIAITKANLGGALGRHIGMTRKELARQGMLEGDGVYHDIMNETSDGPPIKFVMVDGRLEQQQVRTENRPAGDPNISQVVEGLERLDYDLDGWIATPTATPTATPAATPPRGDGIAASRRAARRFNDEQTAIIMGQKAEMTPEEFAAAKANLTVKGGSGYPSDGGSTETPAATPPGTSDVAIYPENHAALLNQAKKRIKRIGDNPEMIHMWATSDMYNPKTHPLSYKKLKDLESRDRFFPPDSADIHRRSKEKNGAATPTATPTATPPRGRGGGGEGEMAMNAPGLKLTEAAYNDLMTKKAARRARLAPSATPHEFATPDMYNPGSINHKFVKNREASKIGKSTVPSPGNQVEQLQTNKANTDPSPSDSGSAAVNVIDNSKVVQNQSNHVDGHMTDSPSAVKEMQLAG